MKLFIPFFMGMVGFIFSEIITRGFQRFRKPKIVCITGKWRCVKSDPLNRRCFKSDDPFSEEILITDGKRVKMQCIKFLNYNENGDIVMGWDNELVTHWHYVPSPPNEKINTFQ